MKYNKRHKNLNPKFNAQNVKPPKTHKAAKAPNIMNKTNTVQSGVNPKLKPPKGPCPKGGEKCYCHPKTVPNH